MELLGFCLSQVYQATLNRDALQLLVSLSGVVARSVYDGRYFDPAKKAAVAAIKELSRSADARLEVGLYKGNIYVQSLSECAGSLYNVEDSSMEASEGLNPESSQGYVEVQSVEAKALARAGQID